MLYTQAHQNEDRNEFTYMATSLGLRMKCLQFSEKVLWDRLIPSLSAIPFTRVQHISVQYCVL